MERLINIALSIGLFALLLAKTFASVYSLPENGSRLIGQPQQHRVVPGDFYQQIAEYYNIGMLALIAANPKDDPFLPRVGKRLRLPTQMLLPYAKREGIVINLSELRLYYFPPNESLVYVFPIGIGRQGLSTPKVVSYIGEKRRDPIWYPPKEMQARFLAEHGRALPKAVPAGPDNPLGKYALRLGTSQYLIHGTNQRTGIGLRASSGCIRMFSHDIEWLYYNVAQNTPVRIVDQPIKMSYEANGRKLIEIHQPLSDSINKQYFSLESPIIKQFIGESESAKRQVAQLLQEASGLVSVIESE